MKQLLLSIIIPMYNTAPYIERCIRSLYGEGLDQSLFEVIVVDDGSTDEGAHCVELLQNEFSNILLIYQENGGLSVARNVGMDHIRGKYLYFLDSDDYLLSFLPIWKKVTCSESDVVVFRAQLMSERGRGKILTSHIPSIINRYYSVEEYLQEVTPETIVWLSLYKVSFVKHNNLHFIPNRYCEDIYFTLNMLRSNPSFEFSKEIVYAYWQRLDSITNHRNNERLQKDSLDQIGLFLCENKTMSLNPIYKKIYYLVVSLMINIYRYNMTHSQFIELIGRLRQMQLYPLPYQSAYPLKYNLFRVVGNNPMLFWLLRKLLKLIY